jgi:3',5'-cyclic AMP phosphodiesterase CpdA
MRIVHLSDTHISHLGGTPSKNFALAVDYLNTELRPDLVINTGDVVILNPDSASDRETARHLHREIGAPLLVLPGNHDVGESADAPWMGISVTSDRVAGFTRTWGPDRFFQLGAAADAADWAFIGINSERLSSGLPEEDEQWEWLVGVAEQVRGKSVMLFLHKPLWFPGGWRSGITIPPSDRRRLISLFAGVGARLRVVANGHVHRYRRAFEGEILTVWSPSLTFASPVDPEHGLEPSQPGIVEYEIHGDAVDVSFRPVPGVGGVTDVSAMAEFTVGMAELGAS